MTDRSLIDADGPATADHPSCPDWDFSSDGCPCRRDGPRHEDPCDDGATVTWIETACTTEIGPCSWSAPSTRAAATQSAMGTWMPSEAGSYRTCAPSGCRPMGQWADLRDPHLGRNL